MIHLCGVVCVALVAQWQSNGFMSHGSEDQSLSGAFFTILMYHVKKKNGTRFESNGYRNG